MLILMSRVRQPLLTALLLLAAGCGSTVRPPAPRPNRAGGGGRTASNACDHRARSPARQLIQTTGMPSTDSQPLGHVA